jgi:hypothetical protein
VIPIRALSRTPVFPIAVYGLVLLNVIAFVHEVEIPTEAARNAFIDDFALIPFDITHGV